MVEKCHSPQIIGIDFVEGCAVPQECYILSHKNITFLRNGAALDEVKCTLSELLASGHRIASYPVIG